MTDLQTAEWLARLAHEGQFRNDGKTPYITHPEYVASQMNSDDARTVAWLHDVIEDTDITLMDLVNLEFPNHIVYAVDAITKRPGEKYLSYLQRVARNSLAYVVKCVDIKHNLSDLKPGTRRDKYELALEYLYLIYCPS